MVKRMNTELIPEYKHNSRRKKKEKLRTMERDTLLRESECANKSGDRVEPVWKKVSRKTRKEMKRYN